MTFKRLLLAASAFALLTTAGLGASADQYQKGLEAFAKRDYNTALSIWMPLAEAGNLPAQFNIARMFDLGIGVTEDDVKAALWYSRAADGGLVQAQRELGLAYLEGEGVEPDIAKGLALLEDAAGAGDSDANFQLGMLYREGQLVTKDYIEAMRWYHTAAAQGHSQAQYMIGFMYGSGYGVPQDFVMAYYYYSLAADEIKISVPARAHLAEYMTADEITKAMSMVVEKRTMASTGQDLAGTPNP